MLRTDKKFFEKQKSSKLRCVLMLMEYMHGVRAATHPNFCPRYLRKPKRPIAYWSASIACDGLIISRTFYNSK
jgi:hypothetical protein